MTFSHFYPTPNFHHLEQNSKRASTISEALALSRILCSLTC